MISARGPPRAARPLESDSLERDRMAATSKGWTPTRRSLAFPH